MENRKGGPGWYVNGGIFRQSRSTILLLLLLLLVVFLLRRLVGLKCDGDWVLGSG